MTFMVKCAKISIRHPEKETAVPKITMLFDPSRFPLNLDEKRRIGNSARPLVASTFSAGHELHPGRDVDFIPQPYPEGTQVWSPVAFEIDAAETPARTEKLTDEVLQGLKTEFLRVLRRIPSCPDLADEDLLIWHRGMGALRNHV